MRRIGLTLAALFAATALQAPAVHAKPAWVKKSQDLGHKPLVANCASCHKAKLPTAKEWTLNDTLGSWLAKKKKDTAAKEIDLTWLKDYKPQAAK